MVSATPTAEPTPTPIPTATIKPTVPPTPVPTATPKPYSEEFVSFIDGTETQPLTYEEILSLKNAEEHVLFSIFAKAGTELPQGQYLVGEDIPAGDYTISAKSDYSSPSIIVKVMGSDLKEKKQFEIGPRYTNDVSLIEGDTLFIAYNAGYEIHAFITSK